MPGTDRVRHCSQCGKNVYSLSAMTRREAEKLLRETEGSLCMRLYRRADGTVLTENCPAGLRAIGARVSRWAGAAISAAMALSTATLPLVQIASGQEQKSEGAITGVVRVGLPDSTRTMTLSDATITVKRDGSGQVYRVSSDPNGKFRLGSLPAGSYEITVELSGFSTFHERRLVGNSKEVSITAGLMLGTVGGGAVGIDALKMPISQELTSEPKR